MHNTISDLIIIKAMELNVFLLKLLEFLKFVGNLALLSGWLIRIAQLISMMWLLVVVYLGTVVAVFVQKLGSALAYLILLSFMGFILLWRRIWFEMDSAFTCPNFFRKDYAPLWQYLQRRWEMYQTMHPLGDGIQVFSYL